MSLQNLMPHNNISDLTWLPTTAVYDDTLLQRIANDPDWLRSASCSSSGDCVVNSNQPEGTYVFAATTADLIPAFLTLSSQILRLSR